MRMLARFGLFGMLSLLYGLTWGQAPDGAVGEALEQAQAQYERGEYDAAEDACTQLIEQYPAFAEAHDLRAKARRSLREHLGARPPANAVLVRGKEDKEAYTSQRAGAWGGLAFVSAFIAAVVVMGVVRVYRSRLEEEGEYGRYGAPQELEGLQEWDVVEPRPEEQMARLGQSEEVKKNPFAIFTLGAKLRERPSWPQAIWPILATSGFPCAIVFLYRMEPSNGWPLKSGWDVLALPLVMFGGATLLINGTIQFWSVLKRVLGWGTPRKAAGGVGQRTASLWREVLSWAFILLAPVAVILFFTEPVAGTGLRYVPAMPAVRSHVVTLYIILAAPCYWIAFFIKVLEIYADTWAYRLRFVPTLRARTIAMARYAHAHSLHYARRNVDTFLVDWVKHPDDPRVVPYYKRDWHKRVWEPPASAVYDGWRSVFGYPANVLSGECNGRRIRVFDYHDCIDFGFPISKRVSYLMEMNPTDFTAVSIEEDYNLPGLLIYPEGLWDKIAKRMRQTDIDMDSIEFSERYRIWSKDRKFAYDVCHGRAMEFLMAHPDMAVRIEDQVRSFRFPALVAMADLTQRIDEAITFCGLLPRYLRDNAQPAPDTQAPHHAG